MFDTPINGENFRAYTVQFLVPKLSPGAIVIMGKHGSNKSKAVRDAIRTLGGHGLLSPAYSRDLNPIEQVIPKLDSLLCLARAQGVDAVQDAIGDLRTRVE